MYSLYVYDPQYQRIGLVENIISLQWLELFQDAGEIKLVVTATDENISFLKEDYQLYNTEHDALAVIRKVEADENPDEPRLTVRATFSMQRWEDRVVMGTYLISNIETALLNIANGNRRGLHGSTAPASGYTVTTDSQRSWGSVLSAFKDFCKGTALGFKEVFSTLTDSEILQIFEGTDRTSQESEDYVGYFGDDIANLDSASIAWDSSTYKNVAVVAGQGEGADRVIVIVSLGEVSGNDRRELFIDAKDLSQTYQIATDTGEVDENGNPIYEYTEATYTAEEYQNILSARGLEKLLEHNRTLSVNANIFEGSLIYREDFYLGDVIPLKLSKYDLLVSARVVGAKTIYEDSCRSVALTLSDFTII